MGWSAGAAADVEVGCCCDEARLKYGDQRKDTGVACSRAFALGQVGYLGTTTISASHGKCEAEKVQCHVENVDYIITAPFVYQHQTRFKLG